MSTSALPLRRTGGPGTAPSPTRGWAAPVALGVFGFLASFAGSWIPSFWGDEAASVVSAERTLPSLFRMLGHVDAVHGAYYLFLHYWIGLFGASELSVRLPSAIAAGALVAGTFVLVQFFTLRRVAVVAAIVSGILPRISFLGAEARSYAFSTAIAVWLTVAVVTLIRRRSVGRLAWLGYAVGMAVGMYVFLYLGLLLVVHGLYIFTSRERATVRRRWLQALVVVVILSLPVVVWGYAERNQIRFLAHRHYNTPRGVLVSQWFGNNLPLAIIAWAMVVLAAVAMVRALLRSRQRFALTELALWWGVLPTLILLGMSLVTPTYDLRYLSFCTPAIAILIAVGAWSLSKHWLRLAAIVAIVGVTIPTDVAQRTPYAKDHGSDLAQTAAVVGAEAQPGDAVVFDRTTRPSERPRLGKHLFPSDYAALKDVALKTPYQHRTGLWDTTFPLDEVYPRLDGVRTVWLLELTGSRDNLDGTDVDTLQSFGYVEESAQTVNRTIIYKFVKGA